MLSVHTEQDSSVLQDGADTTVMIDTYQVKVTLENHGEAPAEVFGDSQDLVVKNQIAETVSTGFEFEFEAPMTSRVAGNETGVIQYEAVLPDRSVSEVLGLDTVHLQDSQPVAIDANSDRDVSDSMASDHTETDTMFRPADPDTFMLESPRNRMRAQISADNTIRKLVLRLY